ncbi:UNVERIFIED_CONTAM: hypothetical protein GTU68_057574 [Idotea baltica]|nr:hypothetical protein [Idotea baltica]
MLNNDIFKRLRDAFDFSNSKVIEIFALADGEVTELELSNWLKKEEDEGYVACPDIQLATFLNGLINFKRGKKEGAQPEPEDTLNNNIVFRKLKIALNLQADDILEILALSDFKISKHELSAFFRKAGHKHFRECKDQALRNFLHGVKLRYRKSN